MCLFLDVTTKAETVMDFNCVLVPVEQNDRLNVSKFAIQKPKQNHDQGRKDAIPGYKYKWALKAILIIIKVSVLSSAAAPAGCHMITHNTFPVISTSV